MQRRAHVWLMAAVLAASLPGFVARAEGANPPGYDVAIDEALAAFDSGSFVAARASFLRAHKILPSARTLRALGMTEFELRRYDEAAAHLALALDSSVRPLTEQQRGEATVLLRKSEDQLATYTLRLAPEHAELRLDGNPVALDAHAALRLTAGEHLLEASAPAYLPWRRELSVRARVNTVLSVQLSPVEQDIPRPAEHEDALAPRKRRWLLWASVSLLVAAGAATGLALALHHDEPARASGGNSGLVWPLDPGRAP